MKLMIRVMIVDDKKLLVDLLKRLIDEQEDIEVVAQALNGKEALEKLATIDKRPDIVLMDINMPEMNGEEATHKILEMYGDEIDVLMLTNYKDGHIIANMLEAGASGYVVKDESASELIKAIRAIYDGQIYYGDMVKNIVMEYMTLRGKQPPNSIQDITPKEKEVLQMIVDGFINKEIADKLNVTNGTIDKHRKKLMDKLNARNAAEIVREAIRHKLVHI